MFAIALALEAAGATSGADDDIVAARGGGGGGMGIGAGLRHRLAYLGLTTAALSHLTAEGFALLTAAVRWSLGHHGHSSRARGSELGSSYLAPSARSGHHVPELHEIFAQQRTQSIGEGEP